MKAWERGIGLQQAQSTFGNESDWKALTGIAMASGLQARNQIELAEQLRLVAEQLGKRSDLVLRIERRTKGLLASGKLLGIGYAVPRRPAHSPNWINQDIWMNAKINWSDSSVAGAGLSFVSVRVLHPAWLAEITSNTAPGTAAPGERRRGRKSSEKYILDAITELLKEGRLDPAAPHKRNTFLIRERALRLFPGEFPGGKGLNDETIRKVLVPALKSQLAGSTGSQNQ